MKAIDILEEISNEVSNANNHFCKTYCGYVDCMKEAGYDSDNYDVSYNDGKIKRSDSVFVTNERLSCRKPNIIMENEDDCHNCVYIYKVK